MSERARIGRVLTVVRPSWPTALIARLLGVSRQSLYHRSPVEPVEGEEVLRGPWRSPRGR